jgi:hypothetical protein
MVWSVAACKTCSKALCRVSRKYEVVRVMSAFPPRKRTPLSAQTTRDQVSSGSPAKSMLSINRSTNLGSTIIGFLRNARNE